MLKNLTKGFQKKIKDGATLTKIGLEVGLNKAQEGLEASKSAGAKGLESGARNLELGVSKSLEVGGNAAKIAGKATAKGVWRAIFTMVLGTGLNWLFLGAMAYPLCKQYCTSIDTANFSLQSFFSLSGNLVMVLYVAFFLLLPPIAYFILGKTYGMIRAANVVFDEFKDEISKLFGLLLLILLEKVDPRGLGRKDIQKLMDKGLKTFDKIPPVLRKIVAFFLKKLPVANIIDELDMDVRNVTQEDIAHKFSEKMIESCDGVIFSPPAPLRNGILGVNLLAVAIVLWASFFG